MVEFTYNNIKNASTDYTSFKFNYDYYIYISFEKNTHSCSRSKIAKNLASELKNLMTTYWENFLHTQELQK